MNELYEEARKMPSSVRFERSFSDPVDHPASNHPAAHAATLLQHVSQGDATKALVDLLTAIEQKHEALILRLEEQMHRALHGHLRQVMGTLANDKTDLEVPVRAIPGALQIQTDADTTFSPVMPISVPFPAPAPAPALAPKIAFGEDAPAVGESQFSPAEYPSTVQESPSKPLVRANSDYKPLAFSRSTVSLNTEYTPVSPRTSITSMFADCMTCELELIEAKDIAAGDLACCGAIPSSDPYIKVVLGDERRRREVFRSHVCMKTRFPVWHAFCKFRLAPTDEEIVIELWDEDMLNADDLLGRVRLNVSNISPADQAEAKWYDIKAENDCPEASGKLSLKASLLSGKASDPATFFNVLGMETGVDDYRLAPPKKGGIQGQLERCPLIIKLQEIVGSPKFDTFFCVFIIINAMTMFFELEYSGRKANAVIGIDTPFNSARLESFFGGVDVFFACLFSLEIVIRTAILGTGFLNKLISWLDIFTVATSVLELVGPNSLMDLTFLRLLRLARLARLFKVFIMATFCNPLRILFKAIYTGFGALFWSLVLLSVIEVLAALFMAQLLSDEVANENNDVELQSFIYTYYGTPSRAFQTMFQITMAPGAWGAVARPLIEWAPGYAAFFLFYVAGVSFAIIRIITALFLRQTLQVASGDEFLLKNEKMKAQRKYTENIRDLFVKADTSGIGEITFEQFQTLLTDPQVMAWLSVLELNPKNACYIFELADNGDQRLTLEEFLSGVFRLKGGAQQIDMVRLQRDARYMRKLIEKIQKDVKLVHASCCVSTPHNGAGGHGGAVDVVLAA